MYMNQEGKAVIKAQLQEVIPDSWKWTLAVTDRSGILLTVRSAPVDLVAEWKGDEESKRRGFIAVNCYYLSRQFNGSLLIMLKILEALNYIPGDAKYYTHIAIGRHNKPFVCK